MRTDPPVLFIIEDDDSVRAALVMLMRLSSYQVRAYPTAEDFLEKDAGSAICDGGCIIADVRMPGIGGPGLQVEMAKRGASIPIVFMTGHGDSDLKNRVLEAGAAAFVTKPFDDVEILEIAEEVLGRDRIAGR